MLNSRGESIFKHHLLYPPIEIMRDSFSHVVTSVFSAKRTRTNRRMVFSMWHDLWGRETQVPSYPCDLLQILTVACQMNEAHVADSELQSKCLLNRVFLDVSIQHRSFSIILKRGKWGGNSFYSLKVSFNSLEALRMAASLDKQMLLRKFREVQKAIQILLLLLVQWCCFCCCFVHAILKQIKK